MHPAELVLPLQTFHLHQIIILGSSCIILLKMIQQIYLKNARHNVQWRKFLMSVKEGKLRKSRTEEVNVGLMLILE
jgi:hypothetical protein